MPEVTVSRNEHEPGRPVTYATSGTCRSCSRTVSIRLTADEALHERPVDCPICKAKESVSPC